MKTNRLAKILAVLLALGAWQAVSMTVGMELLLSSPLSVAARLCTLWPESGFWTTILHSFLRILIGFLIAFFLGSFLAIVAGRFQWVEILLYPYMITIKTVPVASFIIISLIWLKSDQLAVFISFLMVLPILYTNLLQGMKSADPKLLEMAMLFKVPWFRQLLYIYLPAVKPYLLSACTVSLGMAWKSGIAAEVIGVVTGSIGEKLYDSKIYLMTTDLLAWTVVIVAVSVLFEKGFLVLIRMIWKAWEDR